MTISESLSGGVELISDIQDGRVVKPPRFIIPALFEGNGFKKTEHTKIAQEVISELNQTISAQQATIKQLKTDVNELRVAAGKPARP